MESVGRKNKSGKVGRMKITFGRKFFGCMIASAFLAGMFFTTLFMFPQAISSTVVIAYGSFEMFLWVGYIGGNMFSKWVTSKHFHAEYLDGK